MPSTGELLGFVESAAKKAWRALRDGRLRPAPREWLYQLQELWGERHSQPLERAREERKRVHARQCLRELRGFLDSDERIVLARSASPDTTVVVPLHGRAELTLRCLRALARTPSIEVVLVDDASPDATADLLARVDGAEIVCNTQNRGFVAAANQGAARARTRHLLFLNSDAEPEEGAVASSRAIFDGGGVGAVGARLILPDGALQEAGDIVWRDGSCVGYGRGDSPDGAPYRFVRDVDFCSGAFLMTPRALFEELGGFDEAYAPGYYEDVDYCVRVWKRGLRIVYNPEAAVRHYEFASAGSRADAIAAQAERREIFRARHADWLRERPPPSQKERALLEARARPGGLRVLFVDDRVPHARLGSGQPRAAAMVRALVAQGHAVTLYPTAMIDERWERVYEEVPRTVEVMVGSRPDLARFLEERAGFFDRIVVSRPNNLRAMLQCSKIPAPLVYDAEALFAPRDAEERRRVGVAVSREDEQRHLDDELALARRADVVLAVTEEERRAFANAGAKKTLTLGHALDPAPTAAPFVARSGLLFVGAFHRDRSPNSDAAAWLVEELLTRVRARVPSARLVIAGARPPPRVVALAAAHVEVRASVEDLRPLYQAARVFVAPTRFAAGLPYKLHEAAAHGVPIVCTSLVAHQLGWRDDVELLSADDPDGIAARCLRLLEDEATWIRLRAAALARVAEDCAPARFSATLEAALA